MPHMHNEYQTDLSEAQGGPFRRGEHILGKIGRLILLSY